MAKDILQRFRPQVATWFTEVFDAPTPVQERAWQAIADGDNALVVAPTGSGKTLAAFLWALNSLVERPGQTALPVSDPKASHGGVRVLYISPLKALGVDVENNLRAPLTGISRVADRLGLDLPDISVGVRSGDTPVAERARQVRKPPDILITTPESAYLMLTSKAAGILKTVDTVIIDEIHALAGTKRGVHLSLTLERLARLTGGFQRIGLSATVRPLETVANFLGGDRPVEIIAPPAEKQWEFDVHVGVEDMSDLPVPEIGSTIGEATIDDPLGLTGPPGESSEPVVGQQRSIWPFIERDVYEDVMAHRSTLVFVNSRRSAERLTSRLNEIYAEIHDPDSLSPELRRPPAQLMVPSLQAGKAPPVIARAHHGSVSKDERATTERLLKEGALKAVVSTSSLELGIDMGAVDLVIQVESPPSVASGLQRVGRAGHSVGEVSHGAFYPKHRSDLLQSAVTVQRMRAGLIEELHVPTSPLDVLAQQTIAAVSVSDWDVEEWYATVRRSWPYRDLSRDVFDAVIDLVSGVYPSTDFAELRPKVHFDRITGQLQARPGAQRVAVTSGGTIPDRGMFGVFLLGGEGAPRRVGELDEEMVYESRVGDVFTLGASSWRIEDITRDQVLVSPAPGHTGRLPFWTGDAAGRPFELGVALGQFRREVHTDPTIADTLDLDANARTNLLAFLEEQNEATGIIPDEKTLVLERFKDELGDWRVVLHTPFGRPVNAAWALAVGSRFDMDVQAVAGDDGIVLRLPEGESEPDASMFLIDAEDIGDIVTDQVGNSALFASRFRECAARALLLPRRNPGKRAPLWQQRQRASQLLDVARKYPSFPIILETVRECLQDVYDLPSLTQVCADLGSRRIRIAEVTTDQPSPFASSLLFNYTGAFMYEGDSPLAEKRAAALALDPGLLAKLLGTVELRELLDPEIIAEVHAQLQRSAADRRARSPEEFYDILRLLGPIPTDSVPDKVTFPWPAPLDDRVMEVRIGGVPHIAQALDAPLLRDALGIPVPPGVAAQQATILDALDQLLSRWVRTRGPFVLRDVASAFGLGASAAHSALQNLLSDGRVIDGRFRQGVDEQEYCSAEVLTILRRRSLAAARAATQPVSQTALARFLADWQQVAPVGKRPALRGADGVYAVIERLAGVRLPASAWESLVLPGRVGDYQPSMLDELTANGEVVIHGAGTAAARDPWIMLLPTDIAPELVPDVEPEGLTFIQEQVMSILHRGGGFLFGDLSTELTDLVTAEQLREALWGLVDFGLVSPDSFGPLRARLASTGGTTAHRARRRPNRTRRRLGPPLDMAGRWAMSTRAEHNATTRSVALGETWLDRYGVVTRGSIVAEDVLGGFALAYKVLSGFEESGKAMRGYLVEGLGASQFSTPAVIDRLRGCDDSTDVEGWPSGTTDPDVYVLAAADPANPYGAALPWPETGPSRAAGAMVVIADGVLLAHLTRGGRTLTVFHPEHLGIIVDALAAASTHALTVEKLNGEPVFSSPLLATLREAGAQISPKGARIGGRSSAPRTPVRGRTMSQALDDL
ncbi:ATP-dependent helicase [Corynebacterium testudinoris]|uniref:Lhr-like helicase n=1 Tax=Corynebacterium testudinoris TaxID=136857 RepID=A0A0G3H8M5_9CORY|nr:ATP-dependent helicase [Corynebacterium testudinoris]AKK08173.1 Lhr-like helicase [Corynebacterium testudinoris]